MAGVWCVCLFVFISTFNIALARLLPSQTESAFSQKKKRGDACQSTENSWCGAILMLPRGMLASSHGRKPIVSALLVWEAWKTEFVAEWPSFVTYRGSAVRELDHALLFSKNAQPSLFTKV